MERLKKIGAAIGARTKKTGQVPWFAGYKKHTAYWMLRLEGGRWHPLPVCTLIRPGNVKEQRVAKALLNWVRRKAQWPFSIVVCDQGYIDSRLARFLRKNWDVAMLYGARSNMVPPANTEADGCPTCPLGKRLVWYDYDADAGVLVYKGNEQYCRRCPLAGTCPRVFELDPATHETFWGMIPIHSKVARILLKKFRPRAEPGFNIAKNRHGLKGWFLNSRPLARIASVSSDLADCLKILAQIRSQKPQETKNATRLEWKQLELWE